MTDDSTAVPAAPSVARLPAQHHQPTERVSQRASLREVMARFATGVTVITTGGGGGHGMTANAFTSVSLEPPLVLCCVGRAARMHDAMISAQSFAVSILSGEQQGVARYFADWSRPRGRDQFDMVDWFRGSHTGTPMIANALAWLECELVRSYDGGDHTIFVGEVLNADLGGGAEALLFYEGGFHEAGAGSRNPPANDRRAIS